MIQTNKLVLRRSEPHGFRSGGEGLLLSALAQPLQGFGGEPFYVTPLERATSLLYSMVGNHSFEQGNKRTASVTVIDYLFDQGLIFVCSKQEVVQMIVRIAEERLDHETILQWMALATEPLVH